MRELWLLLARPKEAFTNLLPRQPWGLAVAVLVVVAVVGHLSFLPAAGEEALGPALFADPSVYLAAGLPLVLVTDIVFWLVFGSLVYGVARLLGGRGSWTDTLIVLALANLPLVFSVVIVPFTITRALVPVPETAGLAIDSLLVLSLFGLWIWTVILALIGLGYAHAFSIGRAAAAWFLPGCGCLVLFLLFVVALVAVGIALLPLGF